MGSRVLAGLSFFVAFTAARAAFADKVVVFPFASAKGLSKPELEEARKWTLEATMARGHVLPSDAEILAGLAAVRDGAPDTSEEYVAAGRAAGSQWTVSGRLERVNRRDTLPARGPDGHVDEGVNAYRVELEVAQVATGRIESLARDIDEDQAPVQVAEMLALLLRPEGLRNATIPWENMAPPKRKVKPPDVSELGPVVPVLPAATSAYAESHTAAVGLSLGFSTALVRPSEARGSSNAIAVGAAFAYALEALAGVELRGVFTSQVSGPRAIELSAGARYAIPVAPRQRVFVGPEVLAGAHVALGAEKTARFLTHGAAFASWGPSERLQFEVAVDVAAAFGGSGTLILGGSTARALVRF